MYTKKRGVIMKNELEKQIDNLKDEITNIWRSL